MLPVVDVALRGGGARWFRWPAGGVHVKGCRRRRERGEGGRAVVCLYAYMRWLMEVTKDERSFRSFGSETFL